MACTRLMRSMRYAMSGSSGTGLVVLDAGVVIGHLDKASVHHAAATAALGQAAAHATRLMLPVVAFAECLVHPARAGADSVGRFIAALDAIPVGVLDADPSIARTAAALRAQHAGLKLPDAFVVATAIEHHAESLLTTDRRRPPSLTDSIPDTLRLVVI